MAQVHQGEALDEDLVQDPAFTAFILLLVMRAEWLGKSEAGYSIDFRVEHILPRYPAALLPFADDTGGDLWVFDYRADPTSSSIVFIDHELDGEEGVTGRSSRLLLPPDPDRSDPALTRMSAEFRVPL